MAKLVRMINGRSAQIALKNPGSVDGSVASGRAGEVKLSHRFMRRRLARVPG
jgi:hypothetical protein